MNERTEADIIRDARSPEHMLLRAPVQGYVAGIPWPIHLEAYDAYCKRYSPQVAMIDLKGRGCRGGFSTGELDMFIPGWRERVGPVAELQQRLTAAERELAELRARGAEQSEDATDADLEDAIADFIDAHSDCTHDCFASIRTLFRRHAKQPEDATSDDALNAEYLRGRLETLLALRDYAERGLKDGKARRIERVAYALFKREYGHNIPDDLTRRVWEAHNPEFKRRMMELAELAIAAMREPPTVKHDV